MTLEDQLELERDMFSSGKDKYRKEVQKAREGGREAETSYGARLVSQYIEAIAEVLDEKKRDVHRGKRAVALALTEDCDADAMALISLRIVINSIGKTPNMVRVATLIGTAIEDDIRFARFKDAQPFEMQSLLEGFKTRNITEYSRKKSMIRRKALEYEDNWISWTPTERMQVGAYVIDIILETTDLIKKIMIKSGGKSQLRLELTEEVLNWIQSHTAVMELLHPNHMPCLIQPQPWTALDSGGYYSDFMQSRIKFIKIKNAAHAKVLKGHDFSMHMHAVNLMQNTAWQLNRNVLETAQYIWAHSLGTGMPSTEPLEPPPQPFQGKHFDSLTEVERETFSIWRREAMLVHVDENTRKGKIMSFARTLSMANSYKDKEEFYYVYNCDFRGRVYCTTVGMSPQGADLGKALIHFKEGKELGEHGARYLSIHGANMYGEDKLPYSERVKWVSDREEGILQVAADPVSSDSRSFWGNADKPYQFLAFCFEYARYVESGRLSTFVSTLPVGADGTCNGLQHFSALLCDPVGAAATNLSPDTKPQDIYQEVADVVVRKLKESDHEYAAAWREIGITRKITKSPVMTLPYGSTLNACTDSVSAYLMEHPHDHPWTSSNRMKAARFMSQMIWESISEVVIAAREAMEWLRECTKATNKLGLPMIWTSPSGFKVYHGKPKFEYKRIQVSMLGRTRITVGKPLDKLDKAKQLSGVSPNYIHSLDSGHMVMTIINAHTRGITSFAMIHDDYGTHAGDMHNMHLALREEFVNIYHNHSLLQQFVDENTIGLRTEYPPIPERGAFDIREVHNSLYFFG